MTTLTIVHDDASPAETRSGMTRERLERELEVLHADSFGWALACCRWDRDEARDVLQSAYLRALEAPQRFNGDSSARCWFFGIVRNTAAERRRTQVVRGAAFRRWIRLEPDREAGPTPESVSDRSRACSRVRRVLRRLSARQREVLHLVFYQDLTVEQAARVLDLPVGTARKHYQRGKLRLRRLLSEEPS